jgi:polynucleotide 5'-hydroxyl-kinase GRC3/NOL9
VTLVLGASDTGKTSLVTRLAGRLAARGSRVAVVDADLGQSEIGPPTTIGLGRVDGPLARLSAARVEALYFVGATSAARVIGATARGAGALVARARAGGFDRILVDTSGLIAPGIGRALKEAKIRAVDPDLLVCLQRAAECEHILARYADVARPALLRLPALARGRRRSTEERRRHRVAALAAYFASARAVEIDPALVAGGPVGAALEERLVGLLDAAGETVGIGRIARVDAGGVTVETPVALEAIARVVVGQETYSR